MEILLLLLLTVLNGLFAMSEMAVVSARKARLHHLADEGRRGARLALRLTEDPSRFLATTQVGITVIGITSGAFGEATLVKRLAEWLSQWPALAPHADGFALAIVISGITLASLVIGELVPKRVALLDPEAIASLVSRPMELLSKVTYPAVRALSALTEGILKLFGLRASSGPPVSEEEIKVLMEQGTQAGVFEEHEQRLVSRVFRLDELRVAGIMTPRSNIAYLELGDAVENNVKRIVEAGHSRFPVTRGGLDNVVGVVFAKTLLEQALSGRPLELANFTKALFVPGTLTVMQVVASFRQHRQTMALVINEFGDTIGLVTLNDVMEALVGDIATVDDEADRDIVARDENSWFVDGSVTIERLKDILEIAEQLPEQDLGTYHTVAGFAMLQLDRVPRVGDKFGWNAYTFEVVDMDGNRIDKLLITRRPTPPAA